MKGFVSWKGHSWISLLARLYLGGVFIWACIHKIKDPASFALDIATYDILPLYLVNLMAIILPWLELVAGVMLIAGYKVQAAALVISGMMAMFTVAVMMALEKGIAASCGCFASQAMIEDDPISVLTVFRDLSWMILSAYVVLFDRSALGLDRFLCKRHPKTRA